MIITNCPCCGANYPGQDIADYIEKNGMCYICDEEQYDSDEEEYENED